jgi:hypothetical protein
LSFDKKSLDVENRLDMGMWQKYSTLFKSVWIGSAFKGANKPNSMIVNETLYVLNHMSWVKTMENVESLVLFKGIFLTGWQRYDHFSVLCELLPSSVPSLVACMSYIRGSTFPSVTTLLLNTSTFLNCQSPFNYCAFPGSRAHHDVKQLQQFQVSTNRSLDFNDELEKDDTALTDSWSIS